MSAKTPRINLERETGRAQPGDVLGIERDGETTELGDTPEDERDRLEDAEDAEDAAEDEDVDGPRHA